MEFSSSVNVHGCCVDDDRMQSCSGQYSLTLLEITAILESVLFLFFYYWWGGTESLGICSSP
jgi:hypothetical protein